MIIHRKAPYSKMGAALNSSRPCPKPAPTRVFCHIFLDGCSSRKGISNFRSLLDPYRRQAAICWWCNSSTFFWISTADVFNGWEMICKWCNQFCAVFLPWSEFTMNIWAAKVLGGYQAKSWTHVFFKSTGLSFSPLSNRCKINKGGGQKKLLF